MVRLCCAHSPSPSHSKRTCTCTCTQSKGLPLSVPLPEVKSRKAVLTAPNGEGVLMRRPPCACIECAKEEPHDARASTSTCAMLMHISLPHSCSSSLSRACSSAHLLICRHSHILLAPHLMLDLVVRHVLDTHIHPKGAHTTHDPRICTTVPPTSPARHAADGLHHR